MALAEKELAMPGLPEAEEPEDFEPRPLLWSKEQYYKMADLGWFRDVRVELMEGEIIQMSAISSGHWKSTILVGQVMRGIFDKGYTVAEQTSFDGGRKSEPQPDLAVYEGDVRDFNAQPTYALLVVEVSKSTLTYDRTRKAALYASRDIQDYWIVNLRNNVLEVRRQPTTLPGQPADYQSLQTLTAADSIA
ncbi:MAG: Uma2 family endonuclease, partial [Armatimonadetes bacterium]|nr:Uma2 family endonuclease [Armatimonadota bacterium]